MRFFECGCWEMMWEMKFADGDFDVDAEVVFAAENLDDSTARVLRGAGPIGDFDVDDQAFEVGVVVVAGPFFA